MSVVHAVPYYHNGAWCYDAEMDDDYTVIAWQPLPEPYQPKPAQLGEKETP